MEEAKTETKKAEQKEVAQKQTSGVAAKGDSKKAEKPARDVVYARGKDLSMSTKHAIAICRFMKNKKIDYMIKYLEDVSELKKAVPMKGEIPHRPGLGEGRYPIKAAKMFIVLLKNLKANANSANMDVSKIVLQAKSDRASRPRKPGKYHRKFKRTHLEITGTLK